MKRPTGRWRYETDTADAWSHDRREFTPGAMIKANVNDWVIFSRGRDQKQVRKVTHVDAKGRLYFRPSKDWRDGYEPETGHSRNSKGRIERLATKEEIREHLRVEEQKAEDRRREQERRQSQETWTCNSSQAPSSISRNSSSVHLQKMRFMN